ncbi:MAG: L-histidine N(alpha)-methyltransferase [Aquabacterium sp.]
MPTIQVAPARFIQLHHEDQEGVRAELRAGLALSPARVSPKYLYDPLGSRLFDAITELPEYYPTRTEAAIFAAHGPAMAAAVHAAVGTDLTWIDLGAGDGAKSARLFPLMRPRRYVPVDISVAYLRDGVTRLAREHPGIEMVGLGLDFSQRLQLPAELPGGPAVVFYPGSSIGNFAPQDALRLMREAREASGGGALLIGVDLVKASDILEPAYDDALGVTAAFNLNLLKHVNALIGADFHVRDWAHVAFFNTAESRIEMHLQARRDVTVSFDGGQRAFAAGERMHTENSYKWTLPGFKALLHDAGWRDVQHWTDERGWFGVFLALA